MFDQKYGVPKESERYLQMLFDRAGIKSKNDRNRALEFYTSTASWDEPLMPVTMTHILSIIKGETTAEQIEKRVRELSATEAKFIATIKAQTELTSSEARAVDLSLKNANDEFSRKLVTLSDRVEASVETIAKTQSQLIQMHQQLAVRSRQNARGKMQTYGIGALIGLAIALFIQTL